MDTLTIVFAVLFFATTGFDLLSYFVLGHRRLNKQQYKLYRQAERMRDIVNSIIVIWDQYDKSTAPRVQMRVHELVEKYTPDSTEEMYVSPPNGHLHIEIWKGDK